MEESKSSFRWVILAILFLNFMLGVLAMSCIPPLFPEIGIQMPLTKVQMGMAIGVFSLASPFFSPVGGALSDRFGCRWVLSFSVLVVAAAGGMRFFAESASSLIALMFLMGVGFAAYGPVLAKALGTWFPPHELARANGICFASVGFGSALGMGTAANFMSPAFGGWRMTMVVIGGCCLFMGIVWTVMFRDKKSAQEEGIKKGNVSKNFKKVLALRDTWLLGIFFGLNMIGLWSIISLLPVVLEERGIARSGELVSVMMWTKVVFNVLGGVVSDKVGRRKPFLIGSAVLFGLCIPGLITFSGVPLVISLIVTGAAAGTALPIILTIPVEMRRIGPALAGTALGVIFMIGNTGGFIGPVVVGKLIDMTGSAMGGFILPTAALIVSAVVILPIQETGKINHR